MFQDDTHTPTHCHHFNGQFLGNTDDTEGYIWERFEELHLNKEDTMVGSGED